MNETELMFWKDGDYEVKGGYFVRSDLSTLFNKFIKSGLEPVGIKIDLESLNLEVIVKAKKEQQIDINQKDKNMKPGINELKKLLEQASAICADNLELVENIDLHDMMETLDGYVDELCDIGEFVMNGEDDDIPNTNFGVDGLQGKITSVN